MIIKIGTKDTRIETRITNQEIGMIIEIEMNLIEIDIMMIDSQEKDHKIETSREIITTKIETKIIIIDKIMMHLEAIMQMMIPGEIKAITMLVDGMLIMIKTMQVDGMLIMIKIKMIHNKMNNKIMVVVF